MVRKCYKILNKIDFRKIHVQVKLKHRNFMSGTALSEKTTWPGKMQFIRIPYCIHSIAKEVVIFSTPARAAPEWLYFNIFASIQNFQMYILFIHVSTILLRDDPNLLFLMLFRFRFEISVNVSTRY